MEDNSNNRNETPAFGITLILFAILFIVFLNQLPFPGDYKFWNYAGVFAGCCAIVAVIFAVAVGIINTIYKIIIEILVAIILLFNAVYVSLCWVFIDNIVEWMDIKLDGSFFITIAILAVILFLVDLFAVIILLPFARIANSSVFD